MKFNVAIISAAVSSFACVLIGCLIAADDNQYFAALLAFGFLLAWMANHYGEE